MSFSYAIGQSRRNLMNLLNLVILALVQGICELLPVSSSAHVITTEKLLGLDPTAPEMTMLLVMLHTGTMFAVIVYFWKSWRATYFASVVDFRRNGLHVVLATAATGVVGLALLKLIKSVVAKDSPAFEIEHLFGDPRIMAAGLATTGLLILHSAGRAHQQGTELSTRNAVWVGVVQGLCLPFRGLSRSGATISAGLALGVARRRAEEFSFALAVVLTPAGDRQGSLPALQSARRRQCGSRRRAVAATHAKPTWHGVQLQLRRWFAGASLAVALAGAGPLASVRLLLLGSLAAGVPARLTPPALRTRREAVMAPYRRCS
jgi:undecaprenyl-diphosphatase